MHKLCGRDAADSARIMQGTAPTWRRPANGVAAQRRSVGRLRIDRDQAAVLPYFT